MWHSRNTIARLCFFLVIVALIRNECSLALSLKLDANGATQTNQSSLLPKTAVNEWDYFVDTYLRNMMIRRVVDTAPLAQVRGWIVAFLEEQGWTVEEHTFNHTVPAIDDEMNGEKQFVNVIATLDPLKCEKVRKQE